MDRRTLLIQIPGLLAVGAMGARTRPVAAQPPGIVEKTLHDRPWRNRLAFFRQRDLAYAFAGLRIFYIDVARSAPKEKFLHGAPYDDGIPGVYGALDLSFRQRPEAVDDGLQRFSSRELQRNMTDMISANWDHYIQWLDEIGIRNDSWLVDDFARAQAVFTVLAAVWRDETDLDFFSGYGWIWPFCRTFD